MQDMLQRPRVKFLSHVKLVLCVNHAWQSCVCAKDLSDPHFLPKTDPLRSCGPVG